MHSVDKREKTGRLRKNVVRGKTTQNLKNPIGKVFLLTKKILRFDPCFVILGDFRVFKILVKS